MQVVAAESLLGRRRHRAQLIAVKTLVCDVMRDDDVGFGIDDILDVVADELAVPGAGLHGTGIWISQGYLAVRRVGQGRVHRLEPRDLLPDASVAAGKVGDLLGVRLAFLLAVDGPSR